MRYPATGAVFARLLVFAALLAFALAPSLNAQVHGTAPSVTSFGFGGHSGHAPGVPASVTSLGRFGWSGPPRPIFHPNCCRNGFGDHHRRQGFFPGYYSGYYYPGYTYAVPYSPLVLDQPDEEMDDQYQGGPTIFDRRGPGPSRNPDQYTENPRPREATSPPAPAPPDADQPETLLVYKDGHTAELQNYAIVGDYLYDLSGGRRRKIALADLDLKATVQENDDRGIDFRLPLNVQVN